MPPELTRELPKTLRTVARELREAEASLAEAEEGLALTKTAVSSPTGLWHRYQKRQIHWRFGV